MCRLTRGERFKDARTIHNKNGRQTMDEVTAATGVGKSIIQSLEDDGNTRSVGYDKVAKLAAHYGVPSDFLLGLTDDPSIRPSAVDDLGLSPKALKIIQYMHRLQGKETIPCGETLNALLECSEFSVSFCCFLFELADYYYSCRAESAYNALRNGVDFSCSSIEDEDRTYYKIKGVVCSSGINGEVARYMEYTNEMVHKLIHPELEAETCMPSAHASIGAVDFAEFALNRSFRNILSAMQELASKHESKESCSDDGSNAIWDIID